MTQVAKLVTEITADSSKFSAAINKAKGDANSFGNSVKTAAAVATIALTAVASAAALVTKSVFESADRISKLADNAAKIGVTVAALQELSIAARESGVSAESLQTLLGNMNKRLGEAQLGGGKAATALQALGLSFADLSSLSADEKFTVIAEKLRLINDITLQTAVASDIFGKSGKDAIALFNTNIDLSINKVKELGITLTESQKNALDQLSETKDLVGSVWEGFKDNVSAEVAPAFQQLFDGILNSIKEMGGLKDAAKSVADYITAAMHAMSTAIKQAGTAIQFFKNSGLASGIGSVFSLLDKLLKFSWAPVRNLIAATTDRPNMGTSRAKSFTSDDMSSITKKAEEVNQTQQTAATTRALSVYNDETKKATDAIKAMKEQAMKTAETLDKFSAIKNLLEVPGKNQADNILKQATSQPNTGSMLADSTKFQEVFNKLFSDVQTGKTQDGFGGSEIPGMLKTLQEIIDSERQGHMEDYGFEPGKDVSGLVTSLNELKAFLAQKSGPKDQMVEVKIKVDAGKDFVTTVTTSQSFKEAVDKEFDDRLAQAARGNTP